VPQARNTGRSALSLGCCGARAYLDVLTDDVALYAVPGATVGAFAERVAALSQANTILTQFHQIRRRDIEAGKSPTIKESLAALQAAG
jgi:prephenate dehydrogenase